MRLGVRAHDFGKLPVGELAGRIAREGFRCVQLAPPKAIAGFDAASTRLDAAAAGGVRAAFEAAGIQIAVLGCYINPVDPDPNRRGRQLAQFKEYVRRARDFGCGVVGTETGSLNADFSFHPGNRGEGAFQTLVGSVRELVGEAERCGVAVGIEGVERYVISDARRMKRLIDAIGSARLQVIFDPVNLLSAANYARQDDIIKESFELCGDRIAILHAKDFVVDAGGLRSVLAGKGRLNYGLVAELCRAGKSSADILMEDTNPATVAEGVRFLRSVFSI
ncbi:MAG TPA: sugar phosphate isomerase/epimerase family protein [Opitutaceae bacterium]|nr:sugar phosphate isomerase/epimerase family protein [Opitutaceae bacterium]